MSSFLPVDVPPPNPSSPPPPPPAKTLKILSYNIAGLPPVLNINPPLARISAICDWLLASDYDVVLLQEAFFSKWSRAVVDVLDGALPARFPYIVGGALPGRARLSSGLYVASRYPITFAEAVHYSGVGSDKLAHKGCVAVGLDLGGGNAVAAFTSHTQSDKLWDPLWWFTSNERAVATRQAQIDIMARFIREKMEKTQNTIASVLLGDLNYSGESVVSRTGAPGTPEERLVLAPTEEYGVVQGKFQKEGLRAVDVFRQKHPIKEGEPMSYAAAGLTSDAVVNCDSGGEAKRLDFCYLIGPEGRPEGLRLTDARMLVNEWKAEPAGERAARLKKNPGDERLKCLSDHSGLAVEFEVVPPPR